jgi:hypothetical protein
MTVIRAIAIAALMTAAAEARTLRIRVEITGTCPRVRDVKEISVVLNGDEGRPLTLLRDGDQRYWSAPWEDSRSPAFPNARISASVRMDGARTYCRWADAATKMDENSLPIADFVFECDENDVHQVTVDAKSETFVAYVRHLKRVRNDALDSDCDETAEGHRKRTITHVRLPSEEVLLQLGKEKAKPGGPGLLLYSESRANDALTTADPTGRSDWTIGPKLRSARRAGDMLTVERDGIVHASFVQRARQYGTLSSAGIDIEEKVLAKMSSVAITVTRP